MQIPLNLIDESIWIIVSSSLSTQDFSSLFIPIYRQFYFVRISSDTVVSIMEIYKITNGSKLIENKFGSFSLPNKLEIDRQTIYQRRNDLQGYTLAMPDFEVSLLHKCIN